MNKQFWTTKASAILVAVLALPASGAQERVPRPPERIYTEICALCHERRVGPALKGRTLPAVAIKQTVRTGLNGMPAFRPSEIGDRELDAVARYIESSKVEQ
jgi:mono/diheme cytochrome c family protein